MVYYKNILVINIDSLQKKREAKKKMSVTETGYLKSEELWLTQIIKLRISKLTVSNDSLIKQIQN